MLVHNNLRTDSATSDTFLHLSFTICLITTCKIFFKECLPTNTHLEGMSSVKHISPCQCSFSGSIKPAVFFCQCKYALRECCDHPWSSDDPKKVMFGCRKDVLWSPSALYLRQDMVWPYSPWWLASRTSCSSLLADKLPWSGGCRGPCVPLDAERGNAGSSMVAPGEHRHQQCLLGMFSSSKTLVLTTLLLKRVDTMAANALPLHYLGLVEIS